MSDNSRVNNSLRSLEAQTISSIEGPSQKKLKIDLSDNQDWSVPSKDRTTDRVDSNSSSLDNRSISSSPVETRVTPNECGTQSLMFLVEAANPEERLRGLETPDSKYNKLDVLAEAVAQTKYLSSRALSHQSPDSSFQACDSIEATNILPSNDLGQQSLEKNEIKLEDDNYYALRIDLPARNVTVKIQSETLDNATITLLFIINCLVGDVKAVQTTLDDPSNKEKLDLNQKFFLVEGSHKSYGIPICMHLLASSKSNSSNPIYSGRLARSCKISFPVLEAIFSNTIHFIDMTVRDKCKNTMLHKAMKSTFLQDIKRYHSKESERQRIVNLILNYQFDQHERIDINAQSDIQETILHKIITLPNAQINPMLDVLLTNAPKSPELLYEYEDIVEDMPDDNNIVSNIVSGSTIKITSSILHYLLYKILQAEQVIKDICQKNNIDRKDVTEKFSQFFNYDQRKINKLLVLKKAFMKLLDTIDRENKNILTHVEHGGNLQEYAVTVLDDQKDKEILYKIESLYTQAHINSGVRLTEVTPHQSPGESSSDVAGQKESNQKKRKVSGAVSGTSRKKQKADNIQRKRVSADLFRRTTSVQNQAVLPCRVEARVIPDASLALGTDDLSTSFGCLLAVAAQHHDTRVNENIELSEAGIIKENNDYSLKLNVSNRDITLKITTTDIATVLITLPFIKNCIMGESDQVKKTLEDASKTKRLNLNQAFCLHETSEEKVWTTKINPIFLYLLPLRIDRIRYGELKPCRDRYFEMLEAMLKQKESCLDLTLNDKSGYNLLHKSIRSICLSDAKQGASQSAREIIMRLILAYESKGEKIDINAESKEGETALSLVLSHKTAYAKRFLEILLAHDPKPDVLKPYKIPLSKEELALGLARTDRKSKPILHGIVYEIDQHQQLLKKTDIIKEQITIKGRISFLIESFKAIVEAIDTSNQDALSQKEDGHDIEEYVTKLLENDQDKKDILAQIISVRK